MIGFNFKRDVNVSFYMLICYNNIVIFMKKKSLYIIIGIIVLLGLLCFLSSSYIINWLFSSQYNENGISHFLVVTIDESRPREYVGELDGHRIYVEKFNLNETNFRNVEAENVSIKKVVEEKLVSLREWKRYAWKTLKDGDAEILRYDNYEIACAYDDCIISPLSK